MHIFILTFFYGMSVKKMTSLISLFLFLHKVAEMKIIALRKMERILSFLVLAIFKVKTANTYPGHWDTSTGLNIFFKARKNRLIEQMLRRKTWVSNWITDKTFLLRKKKNWGIKSLFWNNFELLYHHKYQT